MNVNLVKIVSRPVLAMGACIALSACAFDPPTDPTSPLATRIQTIVDENREYPRWQDFPAPPENVPTPTYVRSAVQGLEGQQQTLNLQIAQIEWTLTEPAEEYIANIRQRMAADQVEAPTAQTPAEIEAFAAALRARAKAPPPVDRPLR